MADPARVVDVVIVGGGPAGSIVGGLLARRGHRVVILDRAEFPRSKPCGESVNPGAVRELDELGLLPAVLALRHGSIKGWRIETMEGRSFEGSYPDGRSGISVDRAAFDSTLLAWSEANGAAVRTGVRVTDLLRRGDAVVGVETARHGQWQARLVIGADGLRSVVLRRLNLLQRRPRLRKVALTAHVVMARPAECTGILAMTEWGCVGVAPLGGDSANVVLVVNEDACGSIAGPPGPCFDRLIEQIRVLGGARRIGPVQTTGPFDWPTRRVVADGALLVGDAAGYFDPLTGQGIYRAIRGARAAAEVVDARLREDRVGASDLAAYEAMHASAFGGGERIQRIVEVVTSRPWLLSACAALLRNRSHLADRLIGLVGDVRSGPGGAIPVDAASKGVN